VLFRSLLYVKKSAMTFTPNAICKPVFSLIFVGVTFLSGYSQKNVRIEAEKNEHIWMESVAGDQLLMASDKNLFAYSATGELLWKKPFQEPYSSTNNLMITSPSAAYTYRLSFKGNIQDTYNNKPVRVTQISKSGVVKNFELPAKKEYGKTLLTIFCSDQYLYYLTTKDGHERYDDERLTEKLLLNRFSAVDQSYRQFVIDVPPLPTTDDWVFWSYAGQIDNLTYVIAKGWTDENSAEHASIELAGFNSEGEVKVRKKIITTLKDKFMRPVSMQQIGDSHRTYEDQDFVSAGNYLGQTSGAFMGFQTDPFNKCFYAYGLVGPKLFKRVAPEYDGFYVVKYDLEGNEVWRLQQTGDKELVDERIFNQGAAPIARHLTLDSEPDGKLLVLISWPKGSATFNISETGKIQEETSNSPAARFFRSRTDKDKNISYGVIKLNTADVVIRWNEKDPNLELFFFAKE
jgi:hypothetical protein